MQTLLAATGSTLSSPDSLLFMLSNGADLLVGISFLLLPIITLHALATGRLPRTGVVIGAFVLVMGLSADELLHLTMRFGSWSRIAAAVKVFASLAVFSAALRFWFSRRKIRDFLAHPEELSRRASDAGEDRFQLLTNTLEKLVWIAGPNGQVYFYNDFCLTYSGQPRGTPFIDLWRSIVHPDDHLRVQERWWQVVAKGEPYENESRLRNAATGEYRWFKTRAFPVLGKHGEVLRWYGSTTDIHDKRTACQQIEAERGKLASVLRNAPNLVAMFRGNERLCELASPQFSELVGWSDLRGRPLRAVFRDPALEPLLQFVEQVFRSGQPHQQAEFPIVVRGSPRRKRYFNVSVQPVVEASGNTEAVVVYLGDVSAEVEARLRLSASEERFRRIFSSHLIGMFFWNVQGQVVDANDAFLSLTGYSRDDVSAGELSLEQLTPPEYTGLEMRSVEELSAAELCQPFEKEMYRKDGSRFPTLFGSTWVDRNTGEAVSFVLDLTRQRQAEEERTLLKARAESARESSELKSRFLANMSHEIRTPLHAVLGFARLLREGKLDPEQTTYAAAIEDSGENLLRLINDILDLSKIEARRLVFQTSRLRMESLIRRSIETVRMASGKSLPVIFHGGDCPEIFGDELRIGQLLTNIIGNAVKFTPQGLVDVSLAWRALPGSLAEIVVTVEDTGIGIAPAALRRLFQPFEQADGTHARQYSGTGLGLSISRHLAQLMDGDVVLESTEGEGSVATITLRLPLASAAVQASATPASRASRMPAYPGARVLVGEDNPLNQTIVKKLLENMGCRVEIASDGTETLLRLETSLYDLLLLDCQMPDLDGYEVVRRLRRREAGTSRHLPVIAMTADAMAGTETRCLESGMDAYLSKPLDFAHFARTLDRYLEAFRRNPAAAERGGGTVDRKALEMLAEADPHGTLVSQILDIFLATTPERLTKLEESTAGGDERTLLRLLHTLKGSFASVGLSSLAEICAALEEDQMGEKKSDLLTRVKEIRREFELAEEELRELRNHYASALRPSSMPPEGIASSADT